MKKEKNEIKDPAEPLGEKDRARNFIATRQQSYQQVFGGSGKFITEVLGDLARFCRANESSFHPDPRVHAVLEGRREVYLRIEQHLKLSVDDLTRILLKEM